jgi:Mrp family chromosome partitioning ATPase
MDPSFRFSAMQTILVTNTRAYTSGSSIAADMALMIAQSGKKVALIDADLHRPALHKIFDLPLGLGLSDILNNHRSPLSVLNERENGKLSILTSGTGTLSDYSLFNSTKMHAHLQLIKNEFDKVIIHGPPFFYSEALALASLVDSVVLLIHPGYNKTDTSRSIIDKFQRTCPSVVGIIMREQPRSQAKQTAFIDRLLTFDKQARQLS